MQSFFVKKKTVIMEMIILIAFLGGMYYLYSIFSEGEATTAQASTSDGLLGPNFTQFIQAVNQNSLSFKDTNFMNSDLAQRLRDFSETILPTDSRGRADPFVPYASTGSLR